MDTVARGLGQRLGEVLGQSFVVDNRPGAGSQIALEILGAAAPDGHTLMMISATTIVHPMLYKSRFDILRDFAPVSQVSAQGYVLVVHPAAPREIGRGAGAVPARESRQAQLRLLRHRQPDTHERRAISDSDRHPHDPRPVQGHGGGLRSILSADDVELSFPTIISSLPHINAGRLRALAVTPRGRACRRCRISRPWPRPECPAWSCSTGTGCIAPASTPKPSSNSLPAKRLKQCRSPDMAKRLVAEGSDGRRQLAGRIRAPTIRAEHEMWSRVIKQAGIRGE